MVLVPFSVCSGMVLVCCWYGFGMFWHGDGMYGLVLILYGLRMVLVWFCYD